jgi:S-adenosylmethionine:tRNA-ribosyltransferase-isomerase (queuine synthetase)
MSVPIAVLKISITRCRLSALRRQRLSRATQRDFWSCIGRNGALEHRTFRDLPEYLTPNDALVLNQTRVIPARLQARKMPSGGAVEILLAQKLSDERWLALLGGKRLTVGTSPAARRRA